MRSAFRHYLWADLRSSKIPVDMNSIITKLYITWPTWSHTSEIWIFKVIFVVFRLMKNIIFNKNERFGGGNTSNHAYYIFCSKGNCETVYHWFFLHEITVAKIMNNHSYLYSRFLFCKFKREFIHLIVYSAILNYVFLFIKSKAKVVGGV